jgi:rhodanese-related sulfurtransferase
MISSPIGGPMFALTQPPTSLESFTQAYPYGPGLIFAALCLLLLWLVLWPRRASRRRAKNRPVLDPEQVMSVTVGSEALVVDLRTAEAFRTGHIRGALNVPHRDLAARFTTPDPKAKRAMVLVDESDEGAHRALDFLLSRGFQEIYVMQGGLKAWRREGRPLAK